MRRCERVEETFSGEELHCDREAVTTVVCDDDTAPGGAVVESLCRRHADALLNDEFWQSELNSLECESFSEVIGELRERGLKAEFFRQVFGHRTAKQDLKGLGDIF